MSDDRNTLIRSISKALVSKKVPDDRIKEIRQAISGASIRPLRVLYECAVSGGVSTETLTEKYGYNQPPRAARDLRELGFDLKTRYSKTTDKRRMAIYFIDDFSSFSQKQGRKIFLKQEKSALFERQLGKCFYCMSSFSPNELQIDHRVPFEVAGNILHEADGLDALILVCSSCNRSKSWSCESCDNFIQKDAEVCKLCYWYEPDSYSHISGKKRALINVTFEEGEQGFSKFFGVDRASIKKLISI